MDKIFVVILIISLLLNGFLIKKNPVNKLLIKEILDNVKLKALSLFNNVKERFKK